MPLEVSSAEGTGGTLDDRASLQKSAPLPRARQCLDSSNQRTAARQASLSITNSQRLLKLMSTTSVMPSNYLHPLCPLLLQPSIFPSIRVLSNESLLRIKCPEYWSLSFSNRPSNAYSGLMSFRMDWLALLAVLWLSRSCLASFKPMDCGTPGLPVHRQLPELAQTRVRRASDAIQPSSSSVVPFPIPSSVFPSIREVTGHKPGGGVPSSCCTLQSSLYPKECLVNHSSLS